MKILFKLSLTIILTILLIGCDEITGDFNQKQNKNIDTAINVRKILIEDYTGFKCGTCPPARELADKIDSLYPNRIILMNVHAGFFAEPTKTHPYDFRTPEAEILNNYFGFNSYPNGLVNRIVFDGSQIIQYEKWDAAVQSLLSSEPMMNIELAVYYNQYLREILVAVTVKYLKDGKQNHQLVVNILEDSIVQYQTDYRKTPQDIEDYVHNHVFRTSLNGTWGEPLYSSDIKAGSVIRREYKYSIPSGKDWRPEKLRVVAYIHDNGKTNEIFQAEETEKFILIL